MIFKNKTLFACCLVWAALSSGFSWCQVNLLQDGGLESWSSASEMTYWIKEANILTQESSVRHGGNASAKLTRKSSNEGIYQDKAVTSGNIYTLKAWMYNVSDTVKAGVVISWYNAANSPLGYDGPVKASATGGWQQVVLTATAPSNAVMARCRIRIYDKKGGPCYADDAEFYTDTPLSVQVRGCYAVCESDAVAVHWITQSELGTAGFMVLRSDREEGPYRYITTALIPGLGNMSSGRRYVFRDFNAEPGRAYWYKIEELETGGARRIAGTACVRPEDGGIFPSSSELECGYPNPFNPSTTMRFRLSKEDAGDAVSLSVYNLSGEKVKDLFAGANRPGGYTAFWDGRDAQGMDAAGGIYLFVLENRNGILASRRVVKMK